MRCHLLWQYQLLSLQVKSRLFKKMFKISIFRHNIIIVNILSALQRLLHSLSWVTWVVKTVMLCVIPSSCIWFQTSHSVESLHCFSVPDFWATSNSDSINFWDIFFELANRTPSYFRVSVVSKSLIYICTHTSPKMFLPYPL